MDYDVIIEKGRSATNDAIIQFLKAKIGKEKFLDIGTNTAWLIDECPQGEGCDYSPKMVELAKKKGHDVIVANACNLPYKDDAFPICVLSCVLEQIEDWQKALKEAIRVSTNKVIGVSPYPLKSTWGVVGGTVWVKSVIDPQQLIDMYSATILPCVETHYYFEINK
ncbi:MAG TPA: class I SAM-dependent methyltransferase [Candidatus Dojkabacteria bacterium]|nr:class I SAM-dependent methyltransferase [Candidatus Dojkabacteria bacterium]